LIHSTLKLQFFSQSILKLINTYTVGVFYAYSPIQNNVVSTVSAIYSTYHKVKVVAISLSLCTWVEKEKSYHFSFKSLVSSDNK